MLIYKQRLKIKFKLLARVIGDMANLFKKYVGIKLAILTTLIMLVFLVSMASTLTIKPKKAEAVCCSSCCYCLSTLPTDFQEWISNWIDINAHIFANLLIHQEVWFDTVFWQQYMLPAFVQMGVQLSAVGMQQIMAVGQFIDAKEQLETQRLLQELRAEAHKDYHPSVGMCEFGTRIKSLMASERKGEMNSLLLSERSLDRYLGNKSTGAALGQKDDIIIRLNAFQTNFCDPFDNNHGLSLACPDNAPAANPNAAKKNRFNKDIDYQKTLENPWTVDFDLTAGGVPSEGDEEILALSNNLYGFNSFNGGNHKSLQNTARDISDIQKAYLNMRAVVAKTKVAENSFNAIVALKGEGTDGSKEFIEAYITELGISAAEADELLGENPSYYAQMEVLTKKAYQSPVFYTNLYDKPVNVARKDVAMQAIGLIQKFDLLKSYLRTEASLSILLELSVEQLQREVEDNIKALNNKK